MSCNPNQDEFIWPLEYANVTRPNEQDSAIEENKNNNNEDTIRTEWALADYVDPEDEDSEEKQPIAKTTAKPAELVQVITKIRYFISEQHANEFIASCW